MGGELISSLKAFASTSACHLHVYMFLIYVPQPFNSGYEWLNTSDNMIIPDPTTSFYNLYTGAVYQQATSVVSYTGSSVLWLGITTIEI